MVSAHGIYLMLWTVSRSLMTCWKWYVYMLVRLMHKFCELFVRFLCKKKLLYMNIIIVKLIKQSLYILRNLNLFLLHFFLSWMFNFFHGKIEYLQNGMSDGKEWNFMINLAEVKVTISERIWQRTTLEVKSRTSFILYKFKPVIRKWFQNWLQCCIFFNDDKDKCLKQFMLRFCCKVKFHNLTLIFLHRNSGLEVCNINIWIVFLWLCLQISQICKNCLHLIEATQYKEVIIQLIVFWNTCR